MFYIYLFDTRWIIVPIYCSKKTPVYNMDYLIASKFWEGVQDDTKDNVEANSGDDDEK